MCLMACGVIFFVASVGHAVAASAAYLLVSRATASADMGVPLRVQSSGASGGALRSAIHAAQDAGGVAGQRGAAVLAALAAAVDVRSGAEVGVMDGEAGDLGDPQPGLGCQDEERVVTAAVPGRLVGRGEDRVELGGGEVADDGGGGALGLDGQHAADGVHLVGCLQGGVAEQGVDGGQPVVAGGGAVAPGRLQVSEERADGNGVQVGQVELGGLLAGLVVDVAEEQPQGVAVGRDRVRGGGPLGHQPVGEERLQDGRERGHRVAPFWAEASSRAAARARSPGAASRYQYVDSALEWPR